MTKTAQLTQYCTFITFPINHFQYRPISFITVIIDSQNPRLVLMLGLMSCMQLILVATAGLHLGFSSRKANTTVAEAKTIFKCFIHQQEIFINLLKLQGWYAPWECSGGQTFRVGKSVSDIHQLVPPPSIIYNHCIYFITSVVYYNYTVPPRNL